MLKTERMDRVRAALRAQGLTQMIVCDPKSVWYLTGVAVEPYERLLALYLPTEGDPVLFLNRLFNVPEPPCRTVWHTDTDKPVAQIAEVVDAGRPLGIDKEWPAKFLIPLMETHPGMQVVLSSDCVDDCRAVIEFSAEAKRKPDRRDRVEVLRRLHDPRQRRLDRAEQAVGEKQIAARVARQAKLRQRQQIHARRVRLTHPRQNLLRIILHIRDHDVDRPGSGLDKTVFHGTVLLIL